jgi:uncharacterized protein (DUF1800 family)
MGGETATMRLTLLCLSCWLWWIGAVAARPLSFPYREAGLTPQQAAAHLLQRFSFGPTPGQVDMLVREGLETWVEEQLRIPAQEAELEALLALAPEESQQNRLGQRKLLRAVHAQGQLREVMSDFWFNHFNVSLTDDDCRRFVASYESQAIRPHCMGPFLNLLQATAHHPAMLYYLDNAYSTWEERYEPADRSHDPFHYGNKKPQKRAQTVSTPVKRGLNENYAREVLELHTLGVDGGYRQQDVTELARILTGWSVEKNAFVFRPEMHDPNPKKFLYQKIQPNGQAEGEKVLEQLALHSSTARYISRKLAVRFVSDHPPQSLLLRLTRAWSSSRGDTRALLIAILESPEFWSREALGAKIKSPFELQASSLRIVGARLEAKSLNAPQMLESMGQEIYCCRPPTGWPDKADTWLTPGTLVQRLSFAHQLANGQLGGVQVDLSRLRPNKPMASAAQALQAYAATLLPGRDNQGTVKLLQEAALDPSYSQTVIATSRAKGSKIPKPNPKSGFEFTPAAEMNIVGLLLGCPEFQRR